MNNTAFTSQICGLRPHLNQFAIKFTKNVEDADDLVQDTLMKAMRYAQMYKEGTNLKGWLYTIMRNTFINNYRSVSKRQAIVTTSEDLNSVQLSVSASKNLAENKFIQKDINAAMSALSPEYYTPFIKYFEGFKYHEIAEELNIPIGTVKTRIHIARKMLKTNLKMYSQEFGRSRYID